MMAALLVLLLLLAVPPTAFTTTDVYYVRAHDAAGHEQSCPPHQICYKLSYYISQPDSYFISDTTIIFLEGEHSFDREDLVHVSNVHNLTLKGQGQWPVTGAEETVMQSTVIINCTRGRGGFYFGTSHNITVEGLTVFNCGGVGNAVFNFSTVKSLFFQRNSIQHMTGYGLFVRNCDNVIVTNCSYYHSALCDISDVLQFSNKYGGGVGIVCNTQYSNTGYTLELSHTNMTKCCVRRGGGGGISLQTQSGFGLARVVLSHLILSQNSASEGGGLAAFLNGGGDVLLTISNCLFTHGNAKTQGGGMSFLVTVKSTITIQNTDLVENFSGVHYVSEIGFNSGTGGAHVLLILVNSTIFHTKTYSNFGFYINSLGCCLHVILNNTKMTFTKQRLIGFNMVSNQLCVMSLEMNDSQFDGSQSERAVVYFDKVQTSITNSTFSNNTGGQAVIVVDCNIDAFISECQSNVCNTITNSSISGNNMTGITLFERSVVHFRGCNVILNNRNTEGAGITLPSNAYIVVQDELLLYNNTADKHGGAILVMQSLFYSLREPFHANPLHTVLCRQLTSSVTYSGNRAGKGGSELLLIFNISIETSSSVILTTAPPCFDFHHWQCYCTEATHLELRCMHCLKCDTSSLCVSVV